ncbi:non-ribosomal peptide synthetase [Fusarium avenaceum]|nr:non-ribosomal peptide synthetase [Fusarium avenaceum]
MAPFTRDAHASLSSPVSPTQPSAISFPVPPSSVQKILPDETLKYEFLRTPETLSGSAMASHIQAAFALVAGHTANVDSVTFGVSVQKVVVPVKVNLAKDQKIRDYVQAMWKGRPETISPAGTNGNGAQIGSSEDVKLHTLLIIPPWQTDGTVAPIARNSHHEHQLDRHEPYVLTVTLHHDANKTLAIADYDPRVIGTWAVQMLLERFEFILHQLNESTPDQELKDVNTMTPQDLETIWNQNKSVPEPVHRCVHDLIKEQAIARPEAAAVNAWDGNFTYRELDELASRLAGRLVSFGVKENMLVPVCFEKSKWTQVAILAILKSRGGFVLLDSTLPTPRLRSICDQLESEIILSSKNNMELSANLAQRVIGVDLEFIQSLESSIDQQPEHAQSPSTALYTVFTSGSTGTPKGVVVSHGSFSTALHHQLHHLQYNQDSRSFDFGSYAFDITTYNILATFVSGGCLCVPEEKDRKENLGGAIAAFRATITGLTPTVARLLDPSTLPDIQTVMLLGEAVSGKDAEPWWGRCTVLNVYGPAECVLTSINWTAKTPDQITHIGKGVGLVLWIADPDDSNRLVPPGSVGELLMEGPLLSRGYLNEPKQTAEAFLDNPGFLLRGSQNHPGRQGRLYRSGDLVRYNDQEGCLMYVGRKDTQVKIRGQRVELSEVEHHIQCCVPVAQLAIAEVIRPKGEDADPTLAVFMQVSNDEMEAIRLDIGDVSLVTLPGHIQQQIEKRLPPYMVPSFVFSLKTLPLTPTGKTDRKRLRDIAGSISVSDLAALRSVQQGEKRQPMNEAERQIQNLWSKVLKIKPELVGMDDTFASLGGNSISAMKVVAAARGSGMRIQIADIFQKMTIARIAERFSTINENTDSEPLTKKYQLLDSSSVAVTSELRSICKFLLRVNDEDIEDILPCSPNQEYILTVQDEDDSNYRLCLGFDVQIYGEDVQLDLHRLGQAWGELVKHHAMLRTTFVHTRVGNRVKRHSVVFKRAKPSITYMEQREEAKARDVRNNDGPLYRADGPQHHLTICRVNDKAAFLQLQINHAVFDGFTIDILCKDLRAAYHGNLRPVGKYSDFIRYLQSQPQASSLEFWNTYLSDSSPTIFPVSTGIMDACASTRSFSVPGIDSPKIREFCAKWEVMHAIVIHTAWSFVLSAYTGIKCPIFGTFCLGRDVPIRHPERVWGPLIGLIPYKVALDKPRSVLDTLRIAQGDYLASLPHQHTSVAEIEQRLRFQGPKLFNSHITYQKQWGSGISTEDHLVIKYTEEWDPNDYEVGIRPIESPEGFDIQLNFRPGCLSVKQAICLANDYGKAISLILNNPSLQFQDLGL